MEGTPRSIFRSAAVRRYAESKEEAILPRFIAPPTFLCLWILLALLVAGTITAWIARVPEYVSAPATIVEAHEQGSTELVAFVAAPEAAQLRIAERVLLTIGPAGQQVSLPVVAVDRTIRSPDAQRQRFRLQGAAAGIVPQPTAVAIARLPLSLGGLEQTAYPGSDYEAQIEVGSQRVLALLPVVGPLFGGGR